MAFNGVPSPQPTHGTGPYSHVFAAAQALNSPTPPKGFWRRQFSPTATRPQLVFDIFFGVFMPLICFYFDPFIFQTSPAALIRPAAYSMAFLSITGMSIWLVFGEKLKWFGGFLAGLFAAGAGVSLVIGLCLLPVSLIGLVVLIGALGFTPLFTSIVYARNAARAFRSSRPYFERIVFIYAVSFGALFGIALPVVIQREITSALLAAEQHDTISEAEFWKLRLGAPLYESDKLITIYQNSEAKLPASILKRVVIGQLYRERTGEDINNARIKPERWD